MVVTQPPTAAAENSSRTSDRSLNYREGLGCIAVQLEVRRRSGSYRHLTLITLSRIPLVGIMLGAKVGELLSKLGSDCSGVGNSNWLR